MGLNYMPENNDNIRSGAALEFEQRVQMFHEIYQRHLEDIMMSYSGINNNFWGIKVKPKLEYESVETDLP